MTATPQTGLAWNERCMWHAPGPGAGPLTARGFIEPGEHAESATGKRRLKHLVDVSGLGARLQPIEFDQASLEAVLRVHDAAYVEQIRAAAGAGGGDAGDGDSPFGPEGYGIALLAAGGAIAAVDAVLDGAVSNAYALVRPPGHHALRDRGMGFCIFSNCAIAAGHARARGVERVAVVDWDAHHGNGTQAAFYDDPAVLTISIHQEGVFPPDSGHVEDRGEGAGLGFNVNLPLPPGSGHDAYLSAFERLVVPALGAFAPELVLVACGFDSAGMDPHARLMLHSESYRVLTSELMGVAERHAGGRLVLVHEGGYHDASAPFCGLATIETLAGVRTGVDDPFLPNISRMAGQDLQPHQAAAIDRALVARGAAGFYRERPRNDHE